MNCELSEDVLTAFADGELPGAQRGAAGIHLQGCPRCSRRVETLRGVKASLRNLARPEMPPELKALLLASARRADAKSQLPKSDGSVPAALGAWAASQTRDERVRGRKVVSVSGDGGLGQYLTEITTAVKYGMNITHVVLNNNELGKISKEQRAGNWDVWQTSLTNPSFAEYATLCGALGILVETREELGAALQKALAHDGPSLVEIIADALLV